jgi:hypothetical protein
VPFHESVWVVTGTAAPVTALALVVAFSQTVDILRAPASEMLSAINKLPSDRQRAAWTRLDKALTNPSVAAFIIILSDFLRQATLVALSIMSLADQENLIPPWLAMLGTVAGLLLLAAVTLQTTTIRGGIERRFLPELESLQQEPDEPGQHPT